MHQNRKARNKLTVILILLVAVILVGPALAETLPNIIFILADDMGYGDVHALNPASGIPTPNLDRLAAQGMTFTDAHSGSAVCTPTRYGVVTGRYCWRTRLRSGVLNGFSTHLIDPERLTVGKLLQQEGYHTACIGKWHLGMDFVKKGKNQVDYTKPIKFGPTAMGFDYFYGISASLDFTPYVYIENDRFTQTATATHPGETFPAYIRKGDMAPGFKHVESLGHLTDKATAYIRQQGSGKKPFFLYFALTAPHKPVMPSKAFQGKSKRGPYGDFVVEVDSVVGRVDAALRDAGILENTLVMYTSDNGSFMYRLDAPECPVKLTSKSEKPADERDHVTDATIQGYQSRNHTANGLLRGTKADIWEGGHRVPYFVRWPARVKAGTKCETTICLTDLMATCADIVEADLPRNAAEDSVSILPLMLGRGTPDPRPAVVHHSINGTFAIREGKWKLILGSGSGGRGMPKSKAGSTPYQLHDMSEDLSESRNLVDRYPKVAERLAALLDRFRESGRSR